MIRQFRISIVLVLSTILFGCLDLGDSSNRLIKSSHNAARTQKAILFLKEGGATVENSYQISITDFNSGLDNTAVGNVFIVDGNHGKAWLNPECVELTWPATDTLLITYDKTLRVFLQKKVINDVVVTYLIK